MSTRGKITELFDIEAINQQKKQVESLVDQFADKIDAVKPIKLQLEGADTTKKIVKGISEITAAQKEYDRLMAQIASSQAKLNLMESEQAKILAQNKLQLAEVNRNLKEEIQLNNAAEGSLTKKNIELKRLQRSYDALSEAQRNADDGKALLDSIQKLDAEVKSLEGTTGRFGKNVGNYSGALKILEKSLNDVGGKIDQFTKKSSGTDDAIARITKEIEEFSRSGNKSEEVLASLKKQLEEYTKEANKNEDVLSALRQEQELLTKLLNNQATGFTAAAQEVRENTKALQQLAAAGLEGTEAYNKLFAATAELKDETADLKTALNNAAPDDVAFNAASDAAKGLIGIYGLAQSAATAFGVDNEAVAQTLLKLQAAETALQSIEAIRAVFKKENAVAQAVQIGLQKVELFQLNLLTAAESKNIVVKYAAIAAQKLLNAVMSANPILLVVGALVLLTATLSSFTTATNQAQINYEELNSTFEAGAKAVDQSLQSIRNAGDVIIADLEAQGATEKEIREKRIQLREDELKKLQEFVDKNTDYAQKALIERDKMAKGEIDLDETRLEELTKFIENFNKKESEFFKTQREVNILRLNDLRDTRKEEDEERKKQIKSQEDALKRKKDLAERDRRANLELLRLELESQIKVQEDIASNEKKSLNERLDARSRISSLKEQIIQAEKNAELQVEGKTEAEKLVVLKQFITKRLDIERENSKAIADLIRESGEAQKAAELEAKQKRLDALSQSATDEAAIIETGLNDRLSKQAQALQSGLITYEQYQKNISRIQIDSQKEQLNAELDYYEKVLQSDDFTESERINARKELSRIRKELNEIDLQNEKDIADQRIKNEEDVRNAIVALQSQAINTIESLITASFDRRKNQIQDEINAVDIKKQKDIENANATILNEQEKAAAISVINARAQAQKEALERRQRQIDIQRAKFERAASIARVVQETAIQIVKAFPNFALQAIIATMGALQIASIVAQPIPKFKHGLFEDYEGPGIVNDGTTLEAIWREKKKKYEFPTERNLLTKFEKGDRVYPDASQVINEIGPSVMNEFNNTTSYPSFSEAQINQVMMREMIYKLNDLNATMKSRPIAKINNTFAGFTVSWENGQSITKYINDNTQ
ncbi:MULTISPECIES: hypothetical protein [unclassified Paraflavitalea]|uniref:hypothetical protein n=1 Tax=unclassified Paraflavitalea TaxID=2798305 RepID=UPI003D330F1B